MKRVPQPEQAALPRRKAPGPSTSQDVVPTSAVGTEKHFRFRVASRPSKPQAPTGGTGTGQAEVRADPEIVNEVLQALVGSVVNVTEPAAIASPAPPDIGSPPRVSKFSTPSGVKFAPFKTQSDPANKPSGVPIIGVKSEMIEPSPSARNVSAVKKAGAVPQPAASKSQFDLSDITRDMQMGQNYIPAVSENSGAVAALTQTEQEHNHVAQDEDNHGMGAGVDSDDSEAGLVIDDTAVPKIIDQDNSKVGVALLDVNEAVASRPSQPQVPTGATGTGQAEVRADPEIVNEVLQSLVGSVVNATEPAAIASPAPPDIQSPPRVSKFSTPSGVKQTAPANKPSEVPGVKSRMIVPSPSARNVSAVKKAGAVPQPAASKSQFDLSDITRDMQIGRNYIPPVKENTGAVAALTQTEQEHNHVAQDEDNHGGMGAGVVSGDSEAGLIDDTAVPKIVDQDNSKVGVMSNQPSSSSESMVTSTSFWNEPRIYRCPNSTNMVIIRADGNISVIDETAYDASSDEEADYQPTNRMIKPFKQRALEAEARLYIALIVANHQNTINGTPLTLEQVFQFTRFSPRYSLPKDGLLRLVSGKKTAGQLQQFLINGRGFKIGKGRTGEVEIALTSSGVVEALRADRDRIFAEKPRRTIERAPVINIIRRAAQSVKDEGAQTEPSLQSQAVRRAMKMAAPPILLKSRFPSLLVEYAEMSAIYESGPDGVGGISDTSDERQAVKSDRPKSVSCGAQTDDPVETRIYRALRGNRPCMQLFRVFSMEDTEENKILKVFSQM